MQVALHTLESLSDLSSNVESGDNDRRSMLPDGNDDNNMQLSGVPAVIVATTSCWDNSYDRASMPSHHASLLQEERRIILRIHALMRVTMEEPRWEGKNTL